jgi:hypothetical protein
LTPIARKSSVTNDGKITENNPGLNNVQRRHTINAEALEQNIMSKVGYLSRQNFVSDSHSSIPNARDSRISVHTGHGQLPFVYVGKDEIVDDPRRKGSGPAPIQKLSIKRTAKYPQMAGEVASNDSLRVSRQIRDTVAGVSGSSNNNLNSFVGGVGTGNSLNIIDERANRRQSHSSIHSNFSILTHEPAAGSHFVAHRIPDLPLQPQQPSSRRHSFNTTPADNERLMAEPSENLDVVKTATSAQSLNPPGMFAVQSTSIEHPPTDSSQIIQRKPSHNSRIRAYS